MKEVTTRYYCDRCGAEVKPYGKPDEITHGFGYALFTKGRFEFYEELIRHADRFNADAASEFCGMGLCKECLDGLTAYLRNE